MFNWFGWLGRLTIQGRARKEIEQHQRDLYDAERSLALWTHQVEYHRDEITRLKIVMENSLDNTAVKE